MTLVRYAGAAAMVVLLATSLFAYQGNQSAANPEEGCNSLRVIPVTLGSKHLTTVNALDNTAVEVCRDDTVAWHFINTEKMPIEIVLKDFHLCEGSPGDPNQAKKPVKFRGGWFDSDADAWVQPGKSVTMIGRVTMKGGKRGDAQLPCVKYNVLLKPQGKSRILHDPKLQIVEPE